MAAIWVIFSHLAVISKKEKWPADIRIRTWDPRLAYPSARPLFPGLVIIEQMIVEEV